MRAESLAIAKSAMKFLEQQFLAATPKNYALAYLLTKKADPTLVKRVDEVTDGGVRMSQAQADDIFSEQVGALLFDQSATSPNVLDAARHQILRLSDIAATTASNTGAFGRDLEAGLHQLEDAQTSQIGTVIVAMIERSLQAEKELDAASREMAALRQELDTARHDANLDTLTGLFNRRALDAAVRSYEEDGQAFILAICDIDHFKRINDRYGHAVGDRVLRTVAQVLAEGSGKHLVGRWGGEEFLLLFRQEEMAEAVALLDGLRKELGSRPFKLRETDEPMGAITFSAGVSRAGQGVDAASALKLADAALYRAKAQGRNLVLTA